MIDERERETKKKEKERDVIRNDTDVSSNPQKCKSEQNHYWDDDVCCLFLSDAVNSLHRRFEAIVVGWH